MTKKEKIVGFRPLSGIMFSIGRNQDGERHGTEPFPSPLGDYVFNQKQIRWAESLRKEFPSPLGDYVFNHLQSGDYTEFSQVFPSPLGDYVFNQEVFELLELGPDCFRPLSGIMFSIICAFVDNHFPIKCFRPLSGIMFSIRNEYSYLTMFYSSFRPLSGIMFSIYIHSNV